MEGVSESGLKTTFVEQLRRDLDDYVVLNFGVSGTDPLNYQLVVEKYIPLLKPDLVLVCLYDNDYLFYERKAQAHVPLYYEIMIDNRLTGFQSEKPFELNNGQVNDVLKTREEAISYYSNCGKITNYDIPFKKLVGLSSILSTLSFRKVLAELDPAIEDDDAILVHLDKIINEANKTGTIVKFALIPARESIAAKQTLQGYIEPNEFMKVYERIIIAPYEYINSKDLYFDKDPHFNYKGNEAYAAFLKYNIENIHSIKQIP